MSKRPEKIADVKRVACDALTKGTLLLSEHALERMAERHILSAEVNQAILTGYHEARKDKFDELHQAWNYSLRGKTVDGRVLRIVVAVESPHVLVVTAIDLDNEE